MHGCLDLFLPFESPHLKAQAPQFAPTLPVQSISQTQKKSGVAVALAGVLVVEDMYTYAHVHTGANLHAHKSSENKSHGNKQSGQSGLHCRAHYPNNHENADTKVSVCTYGASSHN
jgi:hypothetical protein